MNRYDPLRERQLTDMLAVVPEYVARLDWNRREIVHDGQPATPEGPVGGYLAVETPTATAACILRRCAQLFPKKLEYDGRNFRVGLWPQCAGPLDLRRQESAAVGLCPCLPEPFLEARDPFPLLRVEAPGGVEAVQDA